MTETGVRYAFKQLLWERQRAEFQLGEVSLRIRAGLKVRRKNLQITFSAVTKTAI